MGFNFNFPNFFSSMRFQPTKFSIGGSYGGSYGSSYAQQTYGSSYSQPYSSGTRSFFDMTDLLNQFKTKFTAGYLKSFGVSEPEIKQITQPETKKIYDSTVMQNYGIVCPVKKDQDEDVKISLVAQNYGIMCPLDTIEKPEPKDDKQFEVMQNYGIVCPKAKDDSVKIYDRAMMNYGIVCPKDIVVNEDINNNFFQF